MGSLAFDLVMVNTIQEYRKVGPYAGNIIYTLRLSLGDFDFSLIDDSTMDVARQQIFWAIWIILVVMSLLVMLNFIIAEVSNSYQVIRDNITAHIYRERAGMCCEAEGILPKYF